mgnify:CR=1 FL=1
MKTKRNRKPTNKDLQLSIQQLQYNVVATQSQVTNLTEIISELLEFNDIKDAFMKHLESKTKKIQDKQEKDESEQCIGDEVI